VWLHGEVVENDAGGGPRLAVNVDHFDELGNHSSFEGTLSLMLMATSEGGRQKSLARWDYSAEDVNDAAIDVAFEPTMRFHLELPAETPLDESTELWVRLVPAEGPKLLTHTTIDLQQPGSFSSRSDWPAVDGEANDSAMIASNEAASPADEPEDAVESASEEAPSLGSRIAVNIVGSDWTTARPNEPANLPAEPDPGGGWRASAEIIATVVQSRPAPTPKKPHYDVEPAAHTETAVAPPAPPAYKPPTWSPDRAQPTNDPVRKSRDVARRPAWSATR
jgi:hypothetical protein